MHETPDDLIHLQALLDRSAAAEGSHMRTILTPETRLTAEQLVARLGGMRLLSLATVTRAGEPRNAPVDGFFYRGAFWFGSSPHSFRFRHIRQRSQVSATYLEGEEFSVIVHGHATIVDQESDEFAGFAQYATDVYGDWWPTQMIAWREEWGEPAPYARINATHLYVYARPPEAPSGG